MTDLVIRFVIGGLVVTLFSLISDLLEPKTFAGLFGAAPSIALATLGLTVAKSGSPYAATEARSMILGALALSIYALFVSRLLMRFNFPVSAVTLCALLVWLVAASGLWYLTIG